MLELKTFFSNILKLTIVILILGLYFFGIGFIPSYFSNFFKTDMLINYFVFAYLILGIIVYYYINGVKRVRTKNIKTIIKHDYPNFKEYFKNFFREVKTLAIGILWLLAISTIIVIFVLFGWIVASLSATTIIIILLVLILLKMK